MELRLVNGDYAVGEYHDFESVSGAGETAQRAMMKLAARRGGCAVLPEYGSRLYTLASVKESERDGCVRQFVAEALDGLPPIKMHCSVLAEDAIKAALIDYYKRQGIDPKPIVGFDSVAEMECCHGDLHEACQHA